MERHRAHSPPRCAKVHPIASTLFFFYHQSRSQHIPPPTTTQFSSRSNCRLNFASTTAAVAAASSRFNFYLQQIQTDNTQQKANVESCSVVAEVVLKSCSDHFCCSPAARRNTTTRGESERDAAADVLHSLPSHCRRRRAAPRSFYSVVVPYSFNSKYIVIARYSTNRLQYILRGGNSIIYN